MNNEETNIPKLLRLENTGLNNIRAGILNQARRRPPLG